MRWISLPFPPSANGLFVQVGRRRIRSREYSAWRQHATLLIREAIRTDRIDGAYSLRIQAGRPDRRRRDIDNIIKPISDALVSAGVVADDCACERVEASWVADLSGVQVLVLPMSGARA